MRIGNIFGIPLRISPLALVFAALAVWLGEGARLAVMSGSILLHELFHIAAARVLHIRVIELELMPVGGAARLENLWRLRPAQAAAIALAGPLANLLLIVLSSALCQWGVMSAEWTAVMIEQNAVIFVFNLLPALPMDGGRILCGLLGCRMSIASAAKVGRRIALFLALGLMALSAYGLMRGRINITIPAATVFLLVSARREQQQGECAALESLTGRIDELKLEGVLPMRFLAVDAQLTVQRAAVRLSPRRVHVIAVYDDALRLTRIVNERQLTQALLEDAQSMIGNIGTDVKNVKSKKV